MLLVEVKEEFLKYLVVRNRSQETIIGYEKDIRVFIEFVECNFGKQLRLEDIKEHHIEQYIDYLRIVRKLQPRSQNRYVSSIRSMYNFAFKKRIIAENVAQYVENVQYVRKEREYLSLEELERLISEIDHSIGKIAIQTMMYTGVRISELINLKLTDVDLIQKTIKVKGKGSKERVIPISDKLFAILIDYIKTIRPQKGDYFFATKKTGRISAPYLNKIIREAARDAEIKKKVSAHTLRHSFASYLIKKKVDIATLQQLLGHANIRTTSIYLHVDDEQMREAVNVW